MPGASLSGQCERQVYRLRTLFLESCRDGTFLARTLKKSPKVVPADHRAAERGSRPSRGYVYDLLGRSAARSMAVDGWAVGAVRPSGIPGVGKGLKELYFMQKPKCIRTAYASQVVPLS